MYYILYTIHSIIYNIRHPIQYMAKTIVHTIVQTGQLFNRDMAVGKKLFLSLEVFVRRAL